MGEETHGISAFVCTDRKAEKRFFDAQKHASAWVTNLSAIVRYIRYIIRYIQPFSCLLFRYWSKRGNLLKRTH